MRRASVLLAMLLAFLACADAGTGAGGIHPRLARGPTHPPAWPRATHRRPPAEPSALGILVGLLVAILVLGQGWGARVTTALRGVNREHERT